MDPWTVLGVACVLYTTAELVAAATRRPRGLSFEFGEVDSEGARPISVTLDRRGPDRRAASRSIDR